MTETKKLTQKDLQHAGAKVWEKAGMYRLYLNDSLGWLASEYPDLKILFTDEDELPEPDLEVVKNLKPYINLKSSDKKFVKVNHASTKVDILNEFFDRLDEKLDQDDFLTKTVKYDNSFFGGDAVVKTEELPLVISLFLKVSKEFERVLIETDGGGREGFDSQEDFYNFLEKTSPKDFDGVTIYTQNFTLACTKVLGDFQCRLEEAHHD